MNVLDFFTVVFGIPMFGLAVAIFILLVPLMPILQTVFFAVGLFLFFLGVSNSLKDVIKKKGWGDALK